MSAIFLFNDIHVITLSHHLRHIPLVRSKSQGPPTTKQAKGLHKCMNSRRQESAEFCPFSLSDMVWSLAPNDSHPSYIQHTYTTPQDSQESHPIRTSAPQSHYPRKTQLEMRLPGIVCQVQLLWHNLLQLWDCEPKETSYLHWNTQHTMEEQA